MQTNTSEIRTIIKVFVVSPLPPFSEIHVLTELPFLPPKKMQGCIFLVYKAIIRTISSSYLLLLKKKNPL